MSVNVKFKVGIKKNINTSFNIENKEPIRTIFRINAGSAAFSNILGSPYDNTALAAALDLKADKTEVAGQIETVTDLINSTSETLDNKIDSVQSSLAGDISTLSGTVESYNAATNQRIDETNTTVADNFTTLNGKIEINTQAISDLTQTVADNYNTVNNRIDGVVTSFDGDILNLETSIQDEAEARANADTTLQGNINTLSNTVTSNYTTLDTKIDNTKTAIDGDISDLSDTVSANYTDLSGQISDLSGTIESYNTATNGRIDTLSQTVSANDTAINNKVDGINTTLTNSINSLSDTVTDNYNALDARITANTGNIATNAGNITTINSKIPNQASSSNQLADKDFVNSSIATNTANFIGTFNSVAELEAYTGTLTNNDYAFVATTDSAGNTLYDRYKYNADTQEWLFEYELNNSSFTAQQWASINSGITSGDVTLIGTALQPNDNISELINDTGYITSASLPTVNNGTLDIQVNGTSIGTFTANQSGNTTANIVVPDSATWGNITGTLSDQTDLQTALDSKLQNTARGSKSLNILGNVTNYASSISIGYYSYVPSSDAIAIGYNTQAKSQNSMAIGGDGTTVGTGSNYSIALGIGASVDNSKTRAIQIGEGTNSNRQTLQIGFGTNYNYTLLDGTTGLIPDARISTNIARTSQIPTVPTNISAFTNDSGYITSSALNGYATETWVGNQGYITGITSSDVTTALGYTPYNATNPNGYITASALTPYALSADLASVATSGDYDDLINKPTIPSTANMVTTDTAQNISGRKTFLGEKTIYFKQSSTSNKLGFTLYNPSNTELGALEYRPNTIGSASLLALNCPQTTGGYVGFRYWGTPAVNIVAPKVATAGNYFIPTHITNGTLTVTADNQGTVNISTLLPDVSGFATQTWVQNQNYLTSSALNGYATQEWVLDKEYTSNVGTVTSVNGAQPDSAGNVTLTIPDTSNLANKDLSNLSSTGNDKFQAPLVSGTNIKTVNNTSLLGSGNITIAPDIDNTTITKNSDDELQAIGVIDQNNTTSALKYWTGTKTQYDAISTKDATTLYFLSDVGKIYFGDTLISNNSNGKNIGELVYSSLPLTDAGLHLLDGALIQGSGSYSAFVDYIADLYTANPMANYFTDETTWQNTVTQYGVCGKFVYDSTNNTVRLPKVTGIIEGTTDVSALGDLVQAGLPVHTHTRGDMNITGGLRNNGLKGEGESDTWGAFYYSGGSGRMDYGTTGGEQRPGYAFDASRSWTGSTSNPNYTNSGIQNSSTVQPQTIKCFVYVVIATSTKTDIQVDIDEIATDLNGKADVDLSNTTDQAKILMSSMGMPSNKYIDLTLGASGSKYTAPANGWYIFSKRGTRAGQWMTADCDAQRQCYTSSNYMAEATIYMAVKKGDVLTLYYDLDGENTFSRFIYAQGSESEAN